LLPSSVLVIGTPDPQSAPADRLFARISNNIRQCINCNGPGKCSSRRSSTQAA
jgi:hypothetical protein